MTEPVILAEVWRTPFLESSHRGHAVVCNAEGGIELSWGDPDLTVLPRSSAKMIQALPLVRSGAADAFNLGAEHLALSCASHSAASAHTDRVTGWLDQLGMSDADLRCGSQMPSDRPANEALIRAGNVPCQIHNNCSGKHAGFLTLSKHLKAGPEYLEEDHPVQLAVRAVFEEVTAEASPGFAIDGCSAPNFATSLRGMARAMAHFASAGPDTAEARLISAMTTHPLLVAGEGRACTRLMRAMNGRVAIKTGAEAFFVAIIPEKKLGVALKIVDGSTRAAECAIAAILVKLGVLESDHPEALAYTNGEIRNRRDIVTGHLRAAPALL